LVSVTPWPLQPFWPLQALLALLHAPWPLHSLIPSQRTALLVFFSVLPFANAAPDTNSEATAVARTAFFIDMWVFLPERFRSAPVCTPGVANRYSGGTDLLHHRLTQRLPALQSSSNVGQCLRPFRWSRRFVSPGVACRCRAPSAG